MADGKGAHARSGALVVTSRFTPLLLRYLRAKKIRVDGIADRVGLTLADVEGDVVRLPLHALRRIEADAEALSGDPCVGISAAGWREPGSFGLIEFVARSAATLGDSIAAILRFQRLVLESVVVELEIADDRACLVNRLPGHGGVARHANEFVVATELNLFRAITSRALLPTRAWFSHPAPDNHAVRAIQAFFGTANVAFSAPSDGFELPLAALALAVDKSDPALQAFLERHAVQELPRDAPEDLVQSLRRFLADALHHGVPTAAQAARALGLSSRSLQRRLAERDSTFQAELERMRLDLGRTYLADPTLSIGEVSYLLGYSGPRAFLRAFRRWTGMAPGRFRRSGGAS